MTHQDMHNDRGSTSLFVVIAAPAVLICAGIAVDFSGHAHAEQRAYDVAAQAARAGLQEVDETAAMRGVSLTVNPGAAQAAATQFLATSNIQGTATITDQAKLHVDTTVTYPTKFLSIIGVTELTARGSADARLVRAVNGIEE